MCSKIFTTELDSLHEEVQIYLTVHNISQTMPGKCQVSLVTSITMTATRDDKLHKLESTMLSFCECQSPSNHSPLQSQCQTTLEMYR